MGQRLGIAHPKIGVPGINPHAGEHGLFGDEEQRIIIPAIEAAVKLGIQAEGPIPPDSLYPKAKGGWYDVVLAMYHDQGHIPCKVEGFIYDDESDTWTMSGVNVTLGLPIIRTSVDHGTAFDRAGEGTANARSLIEATHFAIQLAGGRA
jgi:4-hydroxythreonine-4-phosphate dehydrogenase